MRTAHEFNDPGNACGTPSRDKSWQLDEPVNYRARSIIHLPDYLGRDRTEPRRTANWSSLKMILRNSQFIFAAAQTQSVGLISIFLLSDWSVTWRGSNADGLGLGLGFGFGFESRAEAAVGVLAKRLIDRRLQAFWSRTSAWARAACSMPHDHDVAQTGRRGRAGQGRQPDNCNLIVFAFDATKIAQNALSSSIFLFTVSQV